MLPNPLQGRGAGHCGLCSLASPCWTLTHFLEDKARPSPSLSLYVRWEREPKLPEEGMVTLQG